MNAVLHENIEPGIDCITLNRPDLLNAIDGALINGIDGALDTIEASGETRAIILTGAGRGFCAGADLSGTGEPWSPKAKTRMKTAYDAQVRLTEVLLRIYELPIPVIAAVNGVAVGGGLSFALHSDIRVASEKARFGSVFIKAGLSSMDMGTSYLLPHIVGAGRARELMLTGRIIDAAEAEKIGLAQSVVTHAELMDAAIAVGRQIAENNEFGVWQTKIGLNAALDAPSIRHAMEIENRTQILALQTDNMAEATRALKEKRLPTWERM